MREVATGCQSLSDTFLHSCSPYAHGRGRSAAAEPLEPVRVEEQRDRLDPALGDAEELGEAHPSPRQVAVVDRRRLRVGVDLLQRVERCDRADEPGQTLQERL